MTNDGGPAFPGRHTIHLVAKDGLEPRETTMEIQHSGMSLLQHYGGIAMAAILANNTLLAATSKEAKPRGVSIHVAVAAISRIQAQAMIEEFCPAATAGEAVPDITE